ncbi:MAG TPA: condensation domain-containing protein [Verrucomicrobiae bacterium]|nr:condensation domain-containing protein [Verrucomicrobiae bacterium]
MELETVAPISAFPKTVSKPAIAVGAPLIIDPAAPKTLTAALQRTAKEFPNKGIQFVQTDGQTTSLNYPELLNRARRVLAGLKHHGLKPGGKAILQLDRLEDHFAAFWGCLLGGIAPVTVAIAPTYAERNGIVDKLHNTWRLLDQPPIITTERLQDSMADLAKTISAPMLDTLSVETLRRFDPDENIHPVRPEDVAFIQLSSGSTGVPKCIQETHGALIAHIHSSAAFNQYSSDDITFNWLPMDHVVPILTFHLKDTYLGCQQIHASTQLVLNEPLLWLDLMDRFRATHSWAPNFGFKLVSDRLARVMGRHWDLSSLKFLMNAGEQVTLPVVRDFLRATARFGIRESVMQPAFGMAEVCTCMTYANDFNVETGARRFLKSSLNRELEPASSESADAAEFVSLGKVSPGISIRITDSENEVLPERWIGRFQIKGPVVTLGYFRNDEANRDAFVGDGWFNSGDLGFIENGELFLTGREKEMIIIRGAKFYCYEVEDVVNGIPGVEPTFVATCGTGDSATGTETLAVFFVPAGVTDDLAVAQAIRRRVTARLGIAPGFVIPIPKNQFPKTTSGKIQRTQLKKRLEAGAFQSVLEILERDTAGSNDPATAQTEIEKQVAEVWTEIFGKAELSAKAHLFELGGDSLKATQIASRIRERWQIEFPLQLLFGETGTIRGMADWIARNRGAAADVPPPIQRAPRNAVLPLSYSQLRLWLADQIEPGTSLYNIGRAFTLRGALDFAALERALQTLVKRHEILRTVYRMVVLPEQEILPELTIPIPRHDLAHLPAAERERVIANVLSMEIARPFDLAEGPLLRAKLIRLRDEEHLLMLTFHQIVTDAWSLGVFARELAELYAAFKSGNSGTLAPLNVQYADYAVWQQRWLADAALEKQIAFWKTKLASPAAPLNLTAAPETAMDSDESEVQSLVINGKLLNDLRAFNASENVTSYMTLMAIQTLLLARQTKAEELTIGSPESGRRRSETEALLGCFVNMLPIQTRFQSEDTFRSLLNRVRQSTVEAFAHADVPFEKVQVLARREDLNHRLFNTWFGPIDSLRSFSMADLQVSVQPVFPPVAQFDLSCFLSEQPEAITLFFEYRKAAFSSAQIKEWIAQFKQLLSLFTAAPETPLQPARGLQSA